MGNSQTKESRSSGGRSNRDVPSPVRAEHHPPPSHIPPRPPYSTRPRRGSRPDLSFLGIGGSGEPEASALEARRETKAEREARKLEKERATRIRDRERSMKEEHADGGYLVTQGVYVGTEDFNKNIVRQLMVSPLSLTAYLTASETVADRATAGALLERTERLFGVMG